MSEAPLPPKLIQANIAFFKGERAETLRLLDDYQQEGQNAHPGMVGWLRAQVQTDHDTRLTHLHELVNGVRDDDADDAYTQLSRDYLALEETYYQKLHPARKNRVQGRVLLLMGVGLLLIAAGAMVGVNLLNGEGQSGAQIVANGDTDRATESAVPSPTAFPDKSRELPMQDYSARYAGGILQVAAVEIGSERVIRVGTGDPVMPVDGAHFYALRLIFECRSGVCNAPPEAELSLELSNTDLIGLRPDVAIAEEETFQPIALGRTTSGWVIFEIPLVGKVEGLRITPHAEDEDAVTLPLIIPEGE